MKSNLDGIQSICMTRQKGSKKKPWWNRELPLTPVRGRLSRPDWEQRSYMAKTLRLLSAQYGFKCLGCGVRFYLEKEIPGPACPKCLNVMDVELFVEPRKDFAENEF